MRIEITTSAMQRLYHHVESSSMPLEENTFVSQRRLYPHQIEVVRLRA